MVSDRLFTNQVRTVDLHIKEVQSCGEICFPSETADTRIGRMSEEAQYEYMYLNQVV
jgi:hypothetical protein